MNILNWIVGIIAIVTFLFLISAKFIKFFFLYREEKTMIRDYNENDLYVSNVFIDDSEEKLVLYNNYENIFDIEFYEIKFKNNKFIRIRNYPCQKIKKLVAGEKILINTIVPEGIPSLEISWRTKAGDKVSAIVSYNGIDGSTFSIMCYKKNFISFLYHLFN